MILLSKLVIQILIILGVVIVFLVSFYLNLKTKAPKGFENNEKCSSCESTTCMIKLTDVELKKEEMKEYYEKCKEDETNDE